MNQQTTEAVKEKSKVQKMHITNSEPNYAWLCGLDEPEFQVIHTKDGLTIHHVPVTLSEVVDSPEMETAFRETGKIVAADVESFTDEYLVRIILEK